jgi:hypothetical protein
MNARSSDLRRRIVDLQTSMHALYEGDKPMSDTPSFINMVEKMNTLLHKLLELEACALKKS